MAKCPMSQKSVDRMACVGFKQLSVVQLNGWFAGWKGDCCNDYLLLAMKGPEYHVGI